MIAPELVERDVNDEAAVPPKVDVLEHQISPPNLTVGLRHRRDVAPLGLDPCLEAECLECVEEGLVGCVGAARVLLARVDVVTEFVDDMTSAGTHATLPTAVSVAPPGPDKTMIHTRSVSKAGPRDTQRGRAVNTSTVAVFMFKKSGERELYCRENSVARVLGFLVA